VSDGVHAAGRVSLVGGAQDAAAGRLRPFGEVHAVDDDTGRRPVDDDDVVAADAVLEPRPFAQVEGDVAIGAAIDENGRRRLRRGYSNQRSG
jgi:hypothetical protein